MWFGPEPPGGLPVCVVARAGRSRRIGLKLLILVGTDKGVALDKPEVTPQSFMGCTSPKGLYAGIDVRGIDRLSDITTTLESLKASKKCK
jgi:hypothetical protein